MFKWRPFEQEGSDVSYIIDWCVTKHFVFLKSLKESLGVILLENNNILDIW